MSDAVLLQVLLVLRGRSFDEQIAAFKVVAGHATKPVKKPKRVAPIAPTLTADTTLGIIRAIEAKVQAAIDADAMAQALAQAEALALELAWIAEDEADLELLLLAM